VVGMVAISGFRSIGMIELGGVYHRNAGFTTIECADRFCWLSMPANTRCRQDTLCFVRYGTLFWEARKMLVSMCHGCGLEYLSFKTVPLSRSS
jgi:hypothetical protein